MNSNSVWNITCGSNRLDGTVQLPDSKSVANRLQIIHFIGGFSPLSIDDGAPDDITELHSTLFALSSGDTEIDVGNGGTSYRFAVAAAAFKNIACTLISGEQMQNRPIGELIEPLIQLGAKIEYVNKHGFPPVKIVSGVSGGETDVSTQNSGQYASAIALSAPALPKRTVLHFPYEITSKPYFDMTLHLMRLCGAKFDFAENKLTIEPENYSNPGAEHLEKDLSAASYFYQLAALSKQAEITLAGAANAIHQGDKAASKYFEFFGVVTKKCGSDLVIIKPENAKPKTGTFRADLRSTPDLAQTLACTCAGTGVPCELTGLHTLKIKETDRIAALNNELQKLNCEIESGEDFIVIQPKGNLPSGVRVKSYNDHRMVMALAPLALKTGDLEIEGWECVSKSFPGFKNEFERLTM